MFPGLQTAWDSFGDGGSCSGVSPAVSFIVWVSSGSKGECSGAGVPVPSDAGLPWENQV